MTRNASLIGTTAHGGTPIVESPDAAEQLDRLVHAIRSALPPASFAIWQDAPDSKRLFEDALKERAGLKNLHFIEPKNLTAEVEWLQQRSSSFSEADGVVLLGCMSPMHAEEINQVNAALERLLQLPTKTIFVESVSDEKKVRAGFRDLVSQVNYNCRLFQQVGEEEPSQQVHSLPQQADAKNRMPPVFSGTVHEVRQTDAVCWLEIAAGIRVKFAVPLDLLRHLDPQPGLEVLWSPGKERELPTFHKRIPEPPDPELLREVEELNRQFREKLKSWRPRSPDNK
jgi:hypothetical protein